MLFSEFKEKDVINIRNCKNLGNVNDLEIDECNGHIQKIIINGKVNKLCNLFCNDPEYVIAYKDIKQIGPNIILVDV